MYPDGALLPTVSYNFAVKVFRAAAKAVQTGRPAAMATLIGYGGSTPRTSGARMLVYDDQSIVGTIGGGLLEHRIVQACLQAIDAGRPTRIQLHLTRDLGMCCGGSVEVFIEPLFEHKPLVIFGAGHIGQATARTVSSLGFSITLVDPRPEFAPEQATPNCTHHTGDPLGYLNETEPDPEAYYLIVTHDHQLDQALLQHLLPRPSAWLGMIGSRAKVKKFQLRMAAAGLDPKLFERLRAPVGLDIGAETPEEIAVSIAADLIRARRGISRPPYPLSQDR